MLSVVSDSGVNRNTFYYHFKDMPALVRELALRHAVSIIDKSANAANALELVVNSIYDNRKTVMHVWSSAERETFDRELDALCAAFAQHLALAFALTAHLSPDEAEMKTSIYKCTVYGLLSHALQHGLREDERRCLSRLGEESLKLFN